MNKNIIEHNYKISRFERNQVNGHRSFVVWFTGLSGSGKSTIANRLEQVLFRRGIHTYSLDGDNIRTGLSKELGFSEDERHENIRRLAEVAKLFCDAGIIAVTALISPLKKDREFARDIIGRGNFFEVFVNTPLEVCEDRDVKGLYKKARAGDIKNFTGISAAYEAPINPEFEIRTEDETLEESVTRLTKVLEEKLKLK